MLITCENITVKKLQVEKILIKIKTIFGYALKNQFDIKYCISRVFWLSHDLWPFLLIWSSFWLSSIDKRKCASSLLVGGELELDLLLCMEELREEFLLGVRLSASEPMDVLCVAVRWWLPDDVSCILRSIRHLFHFFKISALTSPFIKQNSMPTIKPYKWKWRSRIAWLSTNK